MSQIPKLITAKELAEILGVSQETLAQNRYLGTGVPYIKVGARIRYSLDDVIAYLEANRTSTNA